MKEMKSPNNKKEGFIYGGIICLITVIIMLTFNVYLNIGTLNYNTFIIIVKLLPLVWIVAMIIETLFIGKIAEKLVNKFSSENDGFNAKILFNILFCVTGMSALMTIIGAFIGNGKITIEPIITFPSHWPRNFFIALWCEMLLAQPVARLVMKKIHLKQKKD